MHTPDDKKRFLEEIEEVPIVSIVARRVGIAKSTIYKWLGEDAEFASAFEKAIEQGRQSITDLAEGQTVALMKKGDFRAIRYWLDNNEKRYYKPRKPIPSTVHQRVIKTIELTIVDPAGSPVVKAFEAMERERSLVARKLSEDREEVRRKDLPIVLLKRKSTGQSS